MTKNIDEFRASLVSFSERVQRIRGHIKNEEATKVSLILPFIAVLGYDDRDPTEVSAEHPADFSEKYKNRVDYAILKNMNPIMAIECKSTGNGKKEDRGQLKSYFNACKSVKLGILTDGVLYEFFVDSQEPNMMDDEPFLEIDLEKISKAQVSDTVLESLFALTKDRFDPDTVSENARKSITHKTFFNYLSAQFLDPNIEFTRFLLKENDIKHIRQNAVEAYRSIAKAAFNDVFTSNVLKRLDISDNTVKSPIRAEVVTIPPVVDNLKMSNSVNTTDAEIENYDLVRRRLAFLCNGNPVLYDSISKIKYKDYQGKMTVFYSQERKGKMIDIIEGKDGSIKYVMCDGIDSVAFYDIASCDERLKNLFEKRVAEFLPKKNET